MQKKQDEKECRAAENRAAIQARAEARAEAQAAAVANRQAAAEAKREAKIKKKVEETIERDLIRPLEKAYDQVVKREVQALLTSIKHTLCLDKKKVAAAAKALALKDKRDRDINMLAETLGVSIETARAAAHGDFVVDREHDADMAWTSAPITPRTADETLAQLAKTPALPALPMTPGAVDSNLFVGAVCGRVCERVFVQPYLNEAALARDNLEWLASYLHPDAFVDQAAILLESVEDLEVPSREERFERRFGALLRFCLESYERLGRSLELVPSGHGANALYGFLRARWLRTLAAEAWLEAVPATDRQPCLGRDRRFSVFKMIEEEAHREWLLTAYPAEAALSWTVAEDAEKQLRSLPAAAHQNLAYVVGWAFNGVSKNCRALAKGSETERLLEVGISLARYDAAAQGSFQREPAPLQRIEVSRNLLSSAA